MIYRAVYVHSAFKSLKLTQLQNIKTQHYGKREKIRHM